MCSFSFFDKIRQYLELNDSNEDTTNTIYWIIEWYTPLLHRPLCYNYQHPSHMQIVLQSRCNFSQSTFLCCFKRVLFLKKKYSIGYCHMILELEVSFVQHEIIVTVQIFMIKTSIWYLAKTFFCANNSLCILLFLQAWRSNLQKLALK